MQQRGYLNIQVQGIKVKPKENSLPDPMVLEIKVGELEVKSDPQPPNSAWNLVYLLQVKGEGTRVSFKLNQGETQIGECRFDIQPLIQYEGKANLVDSEMMDIQNVSGATISLRLTYYSAKYGRLILRIDELNLNPAAAAKAKQISARFKLGPFIKTTPPKNYPCQWGDILQLVVLTPNSNLTIEAVSEGQVLGEFVIYNVEKSGLLKERKHMLNNLFWDEKHTGKIKYDVEPFYE